jgi:hypothetical protein
MSESAPAGEVVERVSLLVTVVRAGSAFERQTADNGGHQRSPRIHRNRNSVHLQHPDLVRRRQARWSSSLPTRLPRALGLLPTGRWSPRTGLTLRSSWEPSPPRASVVGLAGRATHVP